MGFVLSRRYFLDRLWSILAGIALFEFFWVVLSFLHRKESGTRIADLNTMIEAGPVESFETNSVTAFPRGHFYLVRLEDGGFLAIHRRCTHLGCTLPWNDEQKAFVCPCHSSVFDIRGDVIRSPASRALDLFPITIENNILWIDTARKLRRSAFRADQVAYH